MMNDRITKKERNLIKGKINSVFSRSELRARVIEASIVIHSDPSRPRVKKWVICNVCKKLEAKSYMEVDHVDPKIPIYSSFEDMSLDIYIDRTWCAENNLQAICPPCHRQKGALEMKERRRIKKESKK